MGASKLAMAIAAATEEARPEGPLLTVEAVEYASRPCGAIFRHIAAVLSRAMEMCTERAAAQVELDERLRELAKLREELHATDAFNQMLSEEERHRTDELQRASDALAAAKADERAAIAALTPTVRPAITSARTDAFVASGNQPKLGKRPTAAPGHEP